MVSKFNGFFLYIYIYKMALGAILGDDLGFGGNFNLSDDSVRGAALLPSKFFRLFFYLKILPLYSYFFN